jgi:DNA-binding MarR family transcriptional regulator
MVEDRISFLLNDLVREMNGHADALLRSNFDLTHSQFVFLLVLREIGETDVTRLAQALGVTKGAVSKRLGWFTERHLVATHQLPDDAKRVMISLTRQGQTLSKEAGDFLEREFLSAISTSPDFKQDLLRNELQKMLAVFIAKRGSVSTTNPPAPMDGDSK